MNTFICTNSYSFPTPFIHSSSVINHGPRSPLFLYLYYGRQTQRSRNVHNLVNHICRNVNMYKVPHRVGVVCTVCRINNDMESTCVAVSNVHRDKVNHTAISASRTYVRIHSVRGVLGDPAARQPCLITPIVCVLGLRHQDESVPRHRNGGVRALPTFHAQYTQPCMLSPMVI